MITKAQQQLIIDALRPYTPKRIGVFGSYARGEERPDSDLDLLIDFDGNINLLDLIRLEQQLGDSFGLKVEIVSTRAVHPKMKDHIEKDLKVIYQ